MPGSEENSRATDRFGPRGGRGLDRRSDFKLNWNVSPYKGPGTYADPSTYQGSVELDASNGDEYDPVTASVLSLTVKADGSGSATFKNLEDQYTNAAVSGSETWTCG